MKITKEIAEARMNLLNEIINVLSVIEITDAITADETKQAPWLILQLERLRWKEFDRHAIAEGQDSRS